MYATLARCEPHRLVCGNCQVSPEGNWEDSDEGGHNYGGGYISLTKGSLLVNSATEFGKAEYNPHPKDYNIYARSAIAIASDYAHETGHWYYDDALSLPKWGPTPEKTKKMKKRFWFRIFKKVG